MQSTRRPVAILLAVIATGLLLLGGAFFAGGLISALADRDELSDSVHAVAEVVAVETNDPGIDRDRLTLVTPTVVFTTEDGAEVTTRLDAGRGQLSYEVGDLVSILYDTADPAVAHAVSDVADNYVQMFISGLAILASLVLYAVALFARLAG